MIECYLNDVAESASPPPRPPTPDAIRFCSWNLNVLCGPDWKTPVAAQDVASVIASLDADVLVLQELPIDTLDVLWDESLREPMARVRELDEILRRMGFTTQLRSLCENTTLLATKLAVTDTEAFTLDEAGPTASINGHEVWTESRGARYAMLVPPPTGDAGSARVPIACYATHLSHKDATLVKQPAAHAQVEVAAANGASAIDSSRASDDALPSMRTLVGEWAGAREEGGVRMRQAATLLRHVDEHARAAAVGEGSLPMCTVVLADFNSPVRTHYDDEEWRVVSEGLNSPHVRQPLDDGVSTLMLSKGFRCAYGLSQRSGRNNFFGRPAPPFTHWTGTVVDFAYVRGDGWAVDGAYVHRTPLSDHLPVIVDLVPTLVSTVP